MWNIEAVTGYKPITTFWKDFSIADNFGERAIVDTYERAFSEWKNNYKYLTELVMVLNWKIWQWFEQNEDRAMTYQILWEKADEWARNNLKGEALTYFYTITD